MLDVHSLRDMLENLSAYVHKKAELDAAGFIRAEENDKRAQTQELDILCYLLYNVYIINIK